MTILDCHLEGFILCQNAENWLFIVPGFALIRVKTTDGS